MARREFPNSVRVAVIEPTTRMTDLAHTVDVQRAELADARARFEATLAQFDAIADAVEVRA